MLGQRIYPIRSYSDGGNGIRLREKGESMQMLFDKILNDLVEQCSRSDSEDHVDGSDVYKLFEKIKKEVVNQNPEELHPELRVFKDRVGYYRFFIHERTFQCKEEEQSKGLPELMNRLIGRNSISGEANYYNQKKNGKDFFSLYSTLILSLHHRLAEEGYGINKKGDFWKMPDFQKAELGIWNKFLCKRTSLDNAAYGIYPYCEFKWFSQSRTLLLVVLTKLDEKFLDRKVKDIDRLPPMHLILFNLNNQPPPTEVFLLTLRGQLRNALGLLSYAVMASRTTESLRIMSREASQVARYWNSQGIDKVLDAPLNRERDLDPGELLATEIAYEIFCANIPGLKRIELFPFDRIYLFSRSNYKAAKRGIKSNDFELKVTVLEAGIMSKRPEDKGRYLTSMERLQFTGGKVNQIKLGQDYDVSDKTLLYKTDFSIYPGPSNGKNVWSIRTDKVEKLSLTNQGQVLVNFDEGGEEFWPSHVSPLPHMTHSMIQEIDERKPGMDPIKREQEIIESIITSLFVKMSVALKSQDNENSSETLTNQICQKKCQSTYEHYDQYGLCYRVDFGVKIDSIKSLEDLQKAYFEIFFRGGKDFWEKTWWAEQKGNQPDKSKFENWIESTESKVTVISFDPSQNVENTDNSGKRYLMDGHGFTLVLVADEDINKTEFDMETEQEDLKQLIRMIIRRVVLEEKTLKRKMREQKDFFNSLLPTVLHRTKNASRMEIKEMTEKVMNLLETEELTADFELLSGQQGLLEVFLLPVVSFAVPLLKPDHPIKDWESGVLKSYKQYIRQKNELQVKKVSTTLQKKETQVPTIQLSISEIPKLQVKFDDGILAEAVKIILNNAFDACQQYILELGKAPVLKINFHYSLNPVTGEYCLECCILNSTVKPIDPEVLASINNPQPRRLDPNKKKENSSGLGLYLVRTQLKTSVGAAADIRLFNLGTSGNYKVEAKLILPARFLEEKVIVENNKDLLDSSDDDVSYKLDSNCILYVEDTIKIVEDNLKYIRETSIPEKIQIISVTNREDAQKRIKTGGVRLILMDLDIIKGPNVLGSNRRNGIRLLEYILKHSRGVPVVIMSGSDEQDFIVDDIPKLELEKHGYSYIGIIEDGFTFPANSLSWGNIKRFSEPQGVCLVECLNNWVAKQQWFMTGENALSKTSTSKAEFTMKSISFSDKKFEDKLEAYRVANVSMTLPKEMLVINSYPRSEDNLIKVIGKWLNHPGIKSLYEDEQDDPELNALASNDNHRTIILHVSVSKATYEKLNYQFRYWCLPHNIWITQKQKLNDQDISFWLSTPHKIRGPFSAFRHQLVNESSGESLKAALEIVRALEENVLFKEEQLFHQLRDEFKNYSKTLSERVESMDKKPNGELERMFQKMAEQYTLYPDSGSFKETLNRILHILIQ